MKVIIEMEIETEDYGGKEFMKEIKKLIADINPNSSLVRFKMRSKYGGWDIGKDIDWKKKED
jgi:hypothetical protein